MAREYDLRDLLKSCVIYFVIGYAIIRIPDLLYYLHNCTKKSVADGNYATDPDTERNYEIEESQESSPKTHE